MCCTLEEGELAEQVHRYTVKSFYDRMVQRGIYRAYVVYEDGMFTLSHPDLMAPLQAFFEASPAFAGHEAVFIGREDDIDTLFFAFVHNTRRGLAQGGLRFCKYSTLAELLEDGLRLSQGMTRKNALARLWWGGGKGIMALPFSVDDQREITPFTGREKYFEAYGRFVASLNGVYYTAEDLGTTTEDMAVIHSHNRFTTCVPTAMGGSGNPSPYTAQGVLRGIQAAWRFLSGTDNLKGVRVAVQGVGNVGAALVSVLDDVGAEVWMADTAKLPYLKSLQASRPGLHIVEQDDAIYDLDVDIFSPCARGAVINPLTIPRLKVKLICGAANNILSALDDARLLYERNIAFVPDYVCNRMGIINCADEWMGYLPEDIQNAVEKVYPDTLRIFEYARDMHITTTTAAEYLADEAAKRLHPLLCHRGIRIIRHLIDNYWADPVYAQHSMALGGYDEFYREIGR
jgi:leucine dehydrogenase